MIFTGFKRKSNQLFFNKKLSELLSNAKVISSKEVNKIIIFLDNTSEIELIKGNLVGILKISKNDIKVVVFKQNVAKDELTEEIVTPKDFGWYGTVKSEKVKSILTEEYDLLINYTKNDTLYRNLLLLQSKAAFRVGFAHSDNRFYDLLIDCETTNFALFNNELKKYLQILNKI